MTEHSGLYNSGNNCFIISILQCLKNCNSIKNGIFDKTEHKKDMISVDLIKNIDMEEFKRKQKYYKTKILYYNFKRIIIHLTKNTEKVIDPSEFIKSCISLSMELGQDYQSLFSGNQSCAGEFFTFLLTNLHESKKKKIDYSFKFNNLSQCHNKTDKILFNHDKNLKIHLDNHYSWITKEFYFSLCSKTGCHKCDYYTINYEPHYILILSIPTIDEDLNIYDCLDHYTEKEIIDNNNLWKCSNCKNESNNYRTIKLINTPKTLMIQFKRHISGSKNSKKIDYPNILNIKNYKIINEEHNNKYELFSVISHIGDCFNSGHYYSICKDNDDFYLFNDSHVNKLNKMDCDENAYMLCYRSID
jgi:ubiquitin C-terminal hydrolase